MGYIDAARVEQLAAVLTGNPYGDYLRALLRQDVRVQAPHADP